MYKPRAEPALHRAPSMNFTLDQGVINAQINFFLLFYASTVYPLFLLSDSVDPTYWAKTHVQWVIVYFCSLKQACVKIPLICYPGFLLSLVHLSWFCLPSYWFSELGSFLKFFLHKWYWHSYVLPFYFTYTINPLYEIFCFLSWGKAWNGHYHSNQEVREELNVFLVVFSNTQRYFLKIVPKHLIWLSPRRKQEYRK